MELALIGIIIIIGTVIAYEVSRTPVPVADTGAEAGADSVDLSTLDYSETPSEVPSAAASTDQGPAAGSTIDPQDESTWPTGDKIWNVCHAIAKAEGYNLPGSIPARLHNPGDLSDGAKTYGSEYHSGSNVTKFPDDETGWQWLYTKIANILNGLSANYQPSMTWTAIGKKYAGNWQAWVANVTRTLGVSPDSTFGAYFS